MAVDERHHGIAHLSQWLSLEDLMSKVKARCPEGTAIPSKALVRLQFAPRNPYKLPSAVQNTSRFYRPLAVSGLSVVYILVF